MNIIARTLYPPNKPAPGDIWINPYTQTIHVFDGSQWCSIGNPIQLTKQQNDQINQSDDPNEAYERAMKIL